MSDPKIPTDDLEKANARLAAWAARSAVDSEALVERLEAMGYALRGKSEDEIAEALRHPPTRPPA
ncbi:MULTISPECIES: hypothetical protein [Methylobacterium]|uniref:Uncharacterized protein n=1 Tax=Methylobacterium jeotgali TaxID=381630 RepID=A0ABQ4T0P8_9HYPH|nr:MULTISPECIES: hypothetical protein [Methylobacterium]PIU07415.1 MAG: hypothetical protein COT56_04945 [Methylobacterium sp. CG09_land_8_20_14_0_10_71_15]PIU13951.1 MAG: hypothetical protein COT28_09410 [Methylobacterium sp. CG08_land_8_20_14_0_20_71_15]GBU17353.1 hypothetical protein AwMethylo_15680 [Methylobacterium sp.]GJE07718.1 hypothetical protein AOPFMNJM_3048 [Methylobacterium jeotgali]